MSTSSNNPNTVSNNPAASEQASSRDRVTQQQQRPGRACDTCRRRKVRCEGGAAATAPGQLDQACTLCTAQGIVCTYEQRATKRGPPKGYVESLERRLEAMESLLASQFANRDHNDAARSPLPLPGTITSNGHHGIDENACFPPSSTGSPQSAANPSLPAATGLDAIDELSMRLNDLSVERNRYVGRSSGMHLVRSMQQYAEPFAPSVMDNESSSTVETLLREEHSRHFRSSVALPPPDLAARLIEAAFDEHQVQWVIPKAFFLECVSKGMVETDATFKGLYFAILAVGSRFIPNTRDPAHTPGEARIVEGWTWYRASLGSSGSLMATPTLWSLLRDTVLVFWQIGSAGYVSCWALAGWGVRQAIDVGAHCENRADWTTSPLRNQLRKRAFFTLVAFDYYISAVLGRPFAIHEDDWDVTPPLDIADADLIEWDRQSNLARLHGHEPPVQPTAAPGSSPGNGYPWASLSSLHSIMASTLKTMYGLKRDNTLKGTRDAVRNLDSRLNAWLEKVPPHVRWNPSQQDDTALLLSATVYCVYYSCQTFVHREFISPARSAALGFPSLAICSNAARSSAHVLDTLRQRGILHRAYAFAPVTAVNNASILLLGRFASQDSNAFLTPSAAADVKRCINVLRDLAPTTFVALKCYEAMVKLASLVAEHPAGQSSSALSRSTGSMHKRPNPDDWTDGHSPAQSSSERPSPTASGDFSGLIGGTADAAAHKQRRLNQHSAHRTTTLPLSTLDLSAETFKGRPTFAADGLRGAAPAATPGSSSGGIAYDHFTAAAQHTSTPTTASTCPLQTTLPEVPTSVAFHEPIPPVQFSLGPSTGGALRVNSLPQLYPTPTSNSFDPALLERDLPNDFFPFPLASTINSTHPVPHDVNRAAADLWSTFAAPSTDGPPTSTAGGNSGSTFRPTGGGGSDLLSQVIDLEGFGDSVPPPTQTDPFSHWNLGPLTQSTEMALLQTDWNAYDPTAFNAS
ncbi:Zn(II)2Cys6 transcription factor [Sporobolomyces koalae]|uniref:Zn(II)2Cys6 transcription factor n=1 Tax=Sporobolomyces koalae TaxID=500713 RepID=UPI0031817291